MTRERHWPFTKPEHKREFAKGFEDFAPDQAERFYALADCQEAGRLEEYHAARKQWKAQEPHPRDFT